MGVVWVMSVGCGASPSGTDDGVDDPPAPDAAGTAPDAASGCGPAAVTCADDEVCVSGGCCAAPQACGVACCAEGFGCVGETCVIDCGATQVACGEPGAEQCCAVGDVCYLGACTTPGAACDELNECPPDQFCEPLTGACFPLADTEACELVPTPEPLAPTLKWAWSGDAAVVPASNQVMQAPMVANLTDDNGDGEIDADDIPDVVFVSFAGGSYNYNGVLRAVSGADGARLWPTAEPTVPVTPNQSVAIGELIAASPGPEVVTCLTAAAAVLPVVDQRILVFGADGTELRRIAAPCAAAPAIADLAHDGVPEVIVNNAVVEADTGTLVGTALAGSARPGVADLDGDGYLDIVAGRVAYHFDPAGATSAERFTQLFDAGPTIGADMAIADLDPSSTTPEVVLVDPGTPGPPERVPTVQMWSQIDGVWAMRWATPSDPLRGGNPMLTGGGPPTVSDFDGDGDADVAIAGGRSYLVLDGLTGAVMWVENTQDRSSRVTGSSIFDFEGDGTAEVLYGDEQFLRVFAGPGNGTVYDPMAPAANGSVLFSVCNTNGTLYEYPVIADVDNDGHADIVASHNDYSALNCGIDPVTGLPIKSGHGIRVFSQASWVKTRRIWNQHTYHITNINEDGTVPTSEAPNWTVPGLNNWRQNKEPVGLFDAPDLVPEEFSCAGGALVVRVVNRGRAAAPAGVPVTFFEGGLPLVTVTTSVVLYPGGSELLASSPYAAEASAFGVTIDGGEPPTLAECRPANNQAALDGCPLVID